MIKFFISFVFLIEKKAPPKDPFADIGNLVGGLNMNWPGGQAQPQKISPQSTQFSSPTHQYGGNSPKPPTTPAHQMRSPNDPTNRPDYSRSHFDAPNQNKKNLKPSGEPGDIFGDILGQQGYSFGSTKNQGSRSINEMRKEEIAKDMDPERLKVMEWVST
jgi:cyclin G-associated kinase